MSMLVDTGAWYAIADSSDRYHEVASRFYTEQFDQASFATTDLILAETWALISSHLGRQTAMTFWETLREARIPILTVDSVDLEGAWHIPHAFSD